MLSRLCVGLALALTLLALPGCGAQPAAAPPTLAATPAAPAPTDAPALTPTADITSMTDTLVATLTAQQPITATQHLQIHAAPLSELSPGDLWLVSTSGSSTRAETEHFVALYLPGAGGWEPVSTLVLTDVYELEAEGVQPVRLAPGRAWVAVKSSSGLVGPCCLDLLSFDGAQLRRELSYHERNINLEQIQIGPGPDGQPLVSIPVELYKGIGAERELFTVTFVWDGQRFVQR